MRLIDADALAKFIDYGHLNNPNEKLYSENDIREMIDMMPVINVVLDFQAETPKHGHWTETYDESQPIFFKRRWACSACGRTNTYGKPPFCMYCGAKMDGERREDG